MKKSLPFILSLLVLTCCTPKPVTQNPPLTRPNEGPIEDFLAFKCEQTARGVLQNTNSLFPGYTYENGFWHVKSPSNWVSGFYPGINWYLYALTGDERFKKYGEHWTEGVRRQATATDNDTGFQIFCSYGLGYNFTGQTNEEYKALLLQGAKTLVDQRYNSTIGGFRAWKQSVSDPSTLPFEINIDMIMNMELVLWAGQNGGPEEYVDYAVAHADTTWEDIVRENGSTFHVASYNGDGTLKLNRTHQGWKDDSTWSRGQAWAVYGYIMAYRYSGLERMLDRSIICFDYFVEATTTQSSDMIPYSDFDAPLDKDNPRDTSAAAIVTSAALELYKTTGDERFLTYAKKTLTDLTTTYLATDEDYLSFLTSASEKWGESEVGAIFGDYYLVESLYRWREWTDKLGFEF